MFNNFSWGWDKLSSGGRGAIIYFSIQGCAAEQGIISRFPPQGRVPILYSQLQDSTHIFHKWLPNILTWFSLCSRPQFLFGGSGTQADMVLRHLHFDLNCLDTNISTFPDNSWRAFKAVHSFLCRSSRAGYYCGKFIPGQDIIFENFSLKDRVLFQIFQWHLAALHMFVDQVPPLGAVSKHSIIYMTYSSNLSIFQHGLAI